jgi:hypothetical protein
MIKDREIAMVNAATLALEYKSKHPRAWDDDAIAHAFKNLDAESELKIYGLAAATEILKLRKGYKDLADKQILQMFVDDIYHILANVEESLKE